MFFKIGDPMPLRDLTMTVTARELSAEAARFICEADRRIDRFQSECRVPAFVPCDYEAAYGLLRTLADGPDIRGRRFCEWGSGFGVVVGLASLLDFDACGIEIEESLVEESRKLAEDFDLPVEFVHGSFVPRGAEERVHAAGSYSWLTTEGDYAYDDLDLEVSDLDLVFAYPWPDEEGVVCELFERYAGTGAILATYHGSGEFRLKRKVSRKKRRR
jgi:hypothetical protein